MPAIPDGETRASEWGKHYPREYDTYMQTRKSDEIGDVLKEDPNIVILWAGYAFSKDYNKPRGHYYAIEDNINTLRTGAPVDANTGPAAARLLDLQVAGRAAGVQTGRRDGILLRQVGQVR